MSNDFKKYNTKNLIISTFLRGLKKSPPFLFWPNDKFFKRFEPEIVKILESEDTIVFVHYEDGTITPYGGPFDLVSDKPATAWLVAQKPNTIISFLVFPQMRKQGVAKKMLIRASWHLEKSMGFNLKYPTYPTFVCAFKSLRDVCRVSVKVDYVNPYL